MAVSALSIGLSMEQILDFDLSLTMGLINERNNQMEEASKEAKKGVKSQEKVIVGNAEMLKAL